jgi:GH43 family beta-xylosidase
LFIIYSAGACWDDNYGLGWLVANKDADLLDPASWTRSTEQVFSQSPEKKAFGPGHNCFTMSPDGTEHWIVYHAKEESSNECAKRELRAQKFEWDKNGYPVFGKPVPINTPIKKPSGWNKY